MLFYVFRPLASDLPLMLLLTRCPKYNTASIPRAPRESIGDAVELKIKIIPHKRRSHFTLTRRKCLLPSIFLMKRIKVIPTQLMMRTYAYNGSNRIQVLDVRCIRDNKSLRMSSAWKICVQSIFHVPRHIQHTSSRLTSSTSSETILQMPRMCLREELSSPIIVLLWGSVGYRRQPVSQKTSRVREIRPQ